MSKFTRHKRKDANHTEIVDFFRKAGAVVDDVSALADLGYDIIVNFRSTVVLVEVKDGDKPPSARQLTDSEKAARAKHGNRFALVESIEQARGLLNSIVEHS